MWDKRIGICFLKLFWDMWSGCKYSFDYEDALASENHVLPLSLQIQHYGHLADYLTVLCKAESVLVPSVANCCIFNHIPSPCILLKAQCWIAWLLNNYSYQFHCCCCCYHCHFYHMTVWGSKSTRYRADSR